MTNEQIMYIDRNNIPSWVLHTGFISHKGKDINNPFDFKQANLHKFFKDGNRRNLESDISKKQIIPYIIFCNNEGDILIYNRKQIESEKRLYDKWSCGFGGHIKKDETIAEAAIREIKEEVNIDIEAKDLEMIGVVNDESNEVNKVHIGIVLKIELDTKTFAKHVKMLDRNTEFLTYHYNTRNKSCKEVLTNVKPCFEKWSMHVVSWLIKGEVK